MTKNKTVIHGGVHSSVLDQGGQNNTIHLTSQTGNTPSQLLDFIKGLQGLMNSSQLSETEREDAAVIVGDLEQEASQTTPSPGKIRARLHAAMGWLGQIAKTVAGQELTELGHAALDHYTG